VVAAAWLGRWGALAALAGPAALAGVVFWRADAWARWMAGGDAPRRARAARAAVALLASLTMLPSLGATSLFDRDEGYYAQASREMLRRGDPFVPTFGGKPWLEKPPLSFWLMASSMAVLGENEFAARLPSALAGAVCALMAFEMGRRMWGLAAGAWAGAALAGSLLFSASSRCAQLDTLFAACVTLSWMGLWDVTDGRGRRGRVLFHLGWGLAMLAKGPLGAALAAAGAAGVMAWSGDWRLVRRLGVLPGVALGLTVFGAWAIPAAWLTDGQALIELVWRRSAAPVFVRHKGHGGQGVLGYLALLPYYLPVLALALAPWTPWLGVAAKAAAAGGWRARRPAMVFGWLAGQGLLLSLAATKLPHYVMPLLPPMAVLLGAGLAAKGARAGWALAAFTAAVAGVETVLRFGPAAALFPEAAKLFFPATAGCAAALIAARLGRPAGAPGRMAAAALLAWAAVWQAGLPAVEGRKTARLAAALIHAAQRPCEAVGLVGYREVSVAFYLDCPVVELESGEPLWGFMSRRDALALIVAERKMREVMRARTFCGAWTLYCVPLPASWVAETNTWETVTMLGQSGAPARGR